MTDRPISASTSLIASSNPKYSSSGLSIPGWISELDNLLDFVVVPTSSKFGAYGNAVKLTDAVVSGTSITSASAKFTAADVGKVIAIQGAGAAIPATSYTPANTFLAFKTTISAFVSATSVTLATAVTTQPIASAWVSGTAYTVGQTVSVSMFYLAIASSNTYKCTVSGTSTVTPAHSVGIVTGADSVGWQYVGATPSGATVVYGTDDSAAIQKAIEAVGANNGGIVDGGGRSYLISDTLEVNYNSITFTNFNIFAVDTSATTLAGAASTINYMQLSALNINVKGSGAYIGPSFPSGKTYTYGSTGYWSGTSSDWLFGVHVIDNVFDYSAVSYGFPTVGGRAIGAGITGTYVGSSHITGNRLVTPQTSGISMRGTFDVNVTSNTVLGMRCYPSSTGDVYGGNAIECMSAYPGEALITTLDMGANRIISNILVGSTDSAIYPGPAIPGTQNTVYTGNIGIDVQVGDRPLYPNKAWAANTAYSVGDRVSTTSVNMYVCTTAGTSSSTKPAATASAAALAITDGTVVWQWVANGGLWVPATAYAVGARCYNQGQAYQCTTAGTSAAYVAATGVAASGPLGFTTSITDGTAVWTWVPGGPQWQQSGMYNAGCQVVVNGNIYQALTSGVAASTGIGPVGRGSYIVDGSIAWTYVRGHLRQVPQSIVSGNVVRKFEFGIMVEGQRNGGAGDAIVSNNDVMQCILAGITFYSDNIDYNSTASWDNGYSCNIIGNRLSECYYTSISGTGTNFNISQNVITDWGYSSNIDWTTLANLTSSRGSIANAITVTPVSSPSIVSTCYGGQIHDNIIQAHNAYDPQNFFMLQGINVSTGSDLRTWRGVSVKNNTIDGNAAVKVSPAAWVASTAYVAGQYVLSSSNIYKCISGGTSSASTGPSGTSGTSITGLADGTATWVYHSLAPAYTTNMSAIILQGMVDDSSVIGNKILRMPYAGIVLMSRRGTADASLCPARVTIKHNDLVDNGLSQNAATAFGIILNCMLRTGYIIESNNIWDTGIGKLTAAVSIASGTSYVLSSIDDVIVRGNKCKGTTNDGYAFLINTTGTNVRVEINSDFNYQTANPMLTPSNWQGKYFPRGMKIDNTNPVEGSATGWVVVTGGSMCSASWTSGTVYSSSTYVSNGVNSYRCTVGGTATVAPTHTTGTVAGSDGVSWAYEGGVAAIDAISVVQQVKTALVAAGTTLATGVALGYGTNFVTSGTGGAVLPTPITNHATFVSNQTSSAINIYPYAAAQQINALGAGVAYSLAAGSTARFVATSATTWAV